jgi:anti-sigma factor RsiW
MISRELHDADDHPQSRPDNASAADDPQQRAAHDRRSDGLQAEYWSGDGYNYAMVSPSNQPTTQMLK